LVTLSSHDKMKETWGQASLLLTPFKEHEITSSYGDENLTFPFWSRSLWDWALDLVESPWASQHFVWDAQRLYKYDGSSFVRFFDEPWTAQRFWDVQVCQGKACVEFYDVCTYAMPTFTRPMYTFASVLLILLPLDLSGLLYSYPYSSIPTHPVHSQSFFRALRVSPSFIIFSIQFLMYLQPVA